MATVMVRVATEFDVVRVKVNGEVQERIDRLKADGKCLGCEAEIQPGAKVRRGLCNTCYSAAYNAMQRKRVTEKQLMERGNLLPPSPGGRKPINAFTQSLAE